MKQDTAFTRRSFRRIGAAAGSAVLLASLGLPLAPAGAVTTAVSSTRTASFTAVERTHPECGALTAEEVPSPDQQLREGPATPPAGTGSLAMPTENADDVELYRTAAYNGTPLSDLDTLQYSTYLETDGGQPQAVRLNIDLDGDGAQDVRLYFIPANNTDTQGRTVTPDVWQTWDAAAEDAVWNEGFDDPSTASTLAEYIEANSTDGDEPTIVAEALVSADRDPNQVGGLSFMQGCASGPAAQVSNLDLIVVGIAGKEIQKYDLEAKAPARSLTITPTSGGPGTKITVTGTDCFEPSATVFLGEGRGDSGGPVDEATVKPAADGTFTATLTVPATAKAEYTYQVGGFCGAAAARAFDYAAKAFDVPSPMTGENGYRMVAADGGIFTFGERNFHGSTGNMTLNKPIVGGATDVSDYDGYWIVASDGGVFTFNAEFHGSLGGQNIAAPAVEIEPTPTGKGYFIVLANGKVYTFGDANFAGDMSGRALNKPVIGMSVTPTGKGYWLVAEDGGIFNFGDAGFFGSMGNQRLNAPVIDLAPAVDNQGYYLLGRDGGVFTFGSADFKGSTGNMTLNAPVIAMLVNPTGSGYWLAATDGGIFTFGPGANFLGSMGGTKLNSPVLDLIN